MKNWDCDWALVRQGERKFWTEEVISKQFLEQYPLDKLVEMGAVRDPNGKAALRVLERELVSQDEHTQTWRFLGVGAWPGQA
jgi:Tfp pilus assembly protein PilP